MRKGTAHSRPNIISISYPAGNVNFFLFISHNFSIANKSFSVTLYSFPSCNFKKLWYYIPTKR